MHTSHWTCSSTLLRVLSSGVTQWKSVTIHPGMMHTLMSFLGCIGTLMKGSSMEQLLAVAFGGIAYILNGKSWTNALRAYRMLVAVLLQDLLKDGLQTDAAITDYLDKAREHPTGRLWVDCLIRPTFITLNFLRTEREGDFLLQQHCPKQMILSLLLGIIITRGTSPGTSGWYKTFHMKPSRTS